MAAPKAANWTVSEEIRLITAVQNRRDALFGAFKGSTRGKEIRKAAWEEVAGLVNACSMSTEKRSGDQAKKKYENMKARVKAKIDLTKRPPTGGGAYPVVTFTESEELLASYIGSSPSVAGLQLGIDTEDPSTSTSIDSEVLASVLTMCERTANRGNVSSINCIVNNEGYLISTPSEAPVESSISQPLSPPIESSVEPSVEPSVVQPTVVQRSVVQPSVVQPLVQPSIQPSIQPSVPTSRRSFGKRKEELTLEVLREEAKKLRAETQKIELENAMIKDKHLLVRYKLQFYKERVSTDFHPEL